MQNRVYNNVEGHRLIDNGRVVEDVTSVSLPTISHPTTTISAAGMAMDVDMPNQVHLEAMELGVNHNNGVNCKYLANPQKHSIEVRVVRQRFNVAGGNIAHESVKVRCVRLHKATEKNAIEVNNPYSSTERFSVLRYEEEIDGNVVTIVDAMSGIIRYNGRDYANDIEAMLN